MYNTATEPDWNGKSPGRKNERQVVYTVAGPVWVFMEEELRVVQWSVKAQESVSGLTNQHGISWVSS